MMVYLYHRSWFPVGTCTGNEHIEQHGKEQHGKARHGKAMALMRAIIIHRLFISDSTGHRANQSVGLSFMQSVDKLCLLF